MDDVVKRCPNCPVTLVPNLYGSSFVVQMAEWSEGRVASREIQEVGVWLLLWRYRSEQVIITKEVTMLLTPLGPGRGGNLSSPLFASLWPRKAPNDT